MNPLSPAHLLLPAGGGGWIWMCRSLDGAGSYKEAQEAQKLIFNDFRHSSSLQQQQQQRQQQQQQQQQQQLPQQQQQLLLSNYPSDD